MRPKCNNCGYYDSEDQQCYYFIDQNINFDVEQPKLMYAQPDDDACEVYTPKEEY